MDNKFTKSRQIALVMSGIKKGLDQKCKANPDDAFTIGGQSDEELGAIAFFSAIEQVAGIPAPKIRTGSFESFVITCVDPGCSQEEVNKAFANYCRWENGFAEGNHNRAWQRLEFIKKLYVWLNGSLETLPIELAKSFNVLPGLPLGGST